jgi:Cu2+-exporting ATPase
MIASVEEMSNQEIDCYHCGLPIALAAPITGKINEVDRDFCCSGCEQVCSIIHDSGMETFYKYAPEDRRWAPPESAPEDAAIFDDIELAQDYVREHENGDYQTTLMIDGMHCPACVWLIEHTLSALDGMVKAEVNFTKNSLSLRWDPEKLKLADVINAIGRVGYRALPFEEDEQRLLQKYSRQRLMFRMAFAGFVTANVMTAAICLYGGDYFGIEARWRALFMWYSMVFTFASIMYSGRTFYISAFKVLRAKRLNMDVPISLGITISFIYSVWNTIAGIGIVYYDSIAMFIFLILIGRYLESAARETAGSATQHLLALLPHSARRLEPDGSEKLVPLRAIRSGDMLRIKPGDKVPVDCVVTEGESRVDESMLSGESVPVKKQVGDVLVGGTINAVGTLLVKATEIGKSSVLSTIMEMVENAQNSRVRTQRIADRIVPYFVGIVLGLSALTFVLWYMKGDLSMAFMAGISVLIITCPCALGLATPMAVAFGAGLGGKIGVLVKDGVALETLTNVDHVVFDKTGTLTRGHTNIKRTEIVDDSIGSDLWPMLLTLEDSSEHPIGNVITAYLSKQGKSLTEYQLEDFESSSGRGVSGVLVKEKNRQKIYAGSLGWLETHNISIPTAVMTEIDAEEHLGNTVIVAFSEEHLLGWVSMGDSLRPEAIKVIEKLHSNNIDVSILSGDRRAVVEAIAGQLGTEPGKIMVMAEVLPEDKASYIKKIQDTGKCVAMVGDGVNDAPALTQADVGVAVANASDVSAHAAQVVLVGGLEKLIVAIRLSMVTMRTIQQNLLLSLGYNVLVLPLAMVGYVFPLLAAIAMPLSSLMVIGNALRIRKRMVIK